MIIPLPVRRVVVFQGWHFVRVSRQFVSLGVGAFVLVLSEEHRTGSAARLGRSKALHTSTPANPFADHSLLPSSSDSSKEQARRPQHAQHAQGSSIFVSYALASRRNMGSKKSTQHNKRATIHSLASFVNSKEQGRKLRGSERTGMPS